MLDWLGTYALIFTFWTAVLPPYVVGDSVVVSKPAVYIEPHAVCDQIGAEYIQVADGTRPCEPVALPN